jgi:hypothetical protein
VVNTTRAVLRPVAAVLAAAVSMTACSRSGEDLATPDVETTTTAPSPAVTSAPDAAGGDDASDAPSTADTVAPATAATDATVPPPVTPISVVQVAEVGVPGLDSDDAFCASWSRYAGSFQVVAVTSAVGSGDSEHLAALEIAAASTVTEAFGEMAANWPAELSSEEELAIDDYFGPFARRLQVAQQALRDVGADDAALGAISDAWLTGLSQRDPSTPEFVVDLPDELWAVIDTAAAEFSSQRVPFGSDPSLVTNVEPEATLAYLAVSCPDQGTLSGQEVDAP